MSASQIALASGAKLTVNADGTYSYNPNGKFNRLTDGTSGAVNTSTVGDTLQLHGDRRQHRHRDGHRQRRRRARATG